MKTEGQTADCGLCRPLCDLLTGLADPVGSKLSLRLSGLAILEEAHPLVSYPSKMALEGVD